MERVKVRDKQSDSDMECKKVREIEGLKEGYRETREITEHSGNKIGAMVSTLD